MPGKSEDRLSHTLVSEPLSIKELFIKDSGPVSADGKLANSWLSVLVILDLKVIVDYWPCCQFQCTV